MKRVGNLWQQIISMENLFTAYHKAKQGKQQRNDVAIFGLNLEVELLLLHQALKTNCYRHGAYRQFIIFERKQRLISAAPFRDRVVHHAIMNALEPVLDARFYFHSYACRKGKGVHKAVDYYQSCSRRYQYVLKLDIARYFPSINHQVLKSQLNGIIKDQQLLDLLGLIIDSSPSSGAVGVGLPIGNLTSQYFANLYLNNIDHWLCTQPECGACLRYVDDVMIFGNDKNALWQLKDRLQQKLLAQGLELHRKKQQLMRTSERVDVLGYLVSRSQRWLRNDNGYRFQRRLAVIMKRYHAGILTTEDVRPSIQSWLGHAMHGDTSSLRAKLRTLHEPFFLLCLR